MSLRLVRLTGEIRDEVGRDWRMSQLLIGMWDLIGRGIWPTASSEQR